MKSIFFCILLFTTSHLFAATFECNHNEFQMDITINMTSDIALKILKDGSEISHCAFKVNEHYDGKKGASLTEMVRYEKISCDRPIKALEIGEKGFLKISLAGDVAHAMIIKDEQPLLCKRSNK